MRSALLGFLALAFYHDLHCSAVLSLHCLLPAGASFFLCGRDRFVFAARQHEKAAIAAISSVAPPAGTPPPTLLRAHACAVWAAVQWRELRLEPHVLHVRELWLLNRSTVWLSELLFGANHGSSTSKRKICMDGLWWRTPLLAGKKRQGTTSTILYVRQPGGHGAIQGSVKRGCHGHGEVRRYLQLPFFAPQSVQERARKHAKGERGARGAV